MDGSAVACFTAAWALDPWKFFCTHRFFPFRFLSCYGRTLGKAFNQLSRFCADERHPRAALET